MKEVFGWFSKKEEKPIHKVEQDSTFGLMKIVRHLQDVKNSGVTQSSISKLQELHKTLLASVKDFQDVSQRSHDSAIKPLFSNELVGEIKDTNILLTNSVINWKMLNIETKKSQLDNLSKVIPNNIFFYTVRNFLRIAVKAFDQEYQGIEGASGDVQLVFKELEIINLKLSQIDCSKKALERMVEEDVRAIFDKIPETLKREAGVYVSDMLMEIGDIAWKTKDKQLQLKVQQFYIKTEFVEHVVGEKMIAQADHYQDAVFIKYASAELVEALKQAEYDAAKRLEEERSELEAERVAVLNAAKLKEEQEAEVERAELEAERVAVLNAAKLKLKEEDEAEAERAEVEAERVAVLNAAKLKLNAVKLMEACERAEKEAERVAILNAAKLKEEQEAEAERAAVLNAAKLKEEDEAEAEKEAKREAMFKAAKLKYKAAKQQRDAAKQKLDELKLMEEREEVEQKARAYKYFELKLQELRFKLQEMKEEKNLLNSTAEAHQRIAQMKRDMDVLTYKALDVIVKLCQENEGVKKEELRQKLKKIHNKSTELQKVIESEEQGVGQSEKVTTLKIEQLQRAIDRIERNIEWRLEQRDELGYDQGALLRHLRGEREEEDFVRELNEQAMTVAEELMFERSQSTEQSYVTSFLEGDERLEGTLAEFRSHQRESKAWTLEQERRENESALLRLDSKKQQEEVLKLKIDQMERSVQLHIKLDLEQREEYEKIEAMLANNRLHQRKLAEQLKESIALRWEARDELGYNEDELLRQERKEQKEEKREQEEENEKEVEPAEQEEKQERKEQEPQVNGTFMATVAAEVLINNGSYVQGEYFCQAELVSNGLPGVHEIEQPSDLSEI